MPALRLWKKANQEFKVILRYIASSRPASATGNLVSKKKKPPSMKIDIEANGQRTTRLMNRVQTPKGSFFGDLFSLAHYKGQQGDQS